MSHLIREVGEGRALRKPWLTALSKKTNCGYDSKLEAVIQECVSLKY